MTINRMTGPDCAVMCSLINTHTHTDTYTVGTEQFQRDFFQEAVNGEPAELVRALVPMEIPKRAFRFCVYLPLPACHICFEQSRPPSHAKLM